MLRSFIGKRRRDEASAFANVEIHLLEAQLGNKHHAITNVDPVGVIEHFTFAHVARESARWTHLLRENGLRPGDPVLVLAGREWAWRCALLGVLRAGGVAVPCEASLPLEETRAIAANAGAAHLISIPPRPDLVEPEGPALLSAADLDAIDASKALHEPAHESQREDAAIVVYTRSATSLRGAVHTHASLIAQADAGKHWLGVGEGEAVWCTATDGSPESIWLLLAGWQAGANIVTVELELGPEDQLELLGRLGTTAVWFSDEEYDRLASAAPAAWMDGSIRVLLSDERSNGATAFANAVGAHVAAVFGLAELGVVAGWPAGSETEDTIRAARPLPGVELSIVGEQGTRLPTGLVGDVVVRGGTPSLISGDAGSGNGVPQADWWYRLGWRGALAADGALRLASRSPAELEPVEAGVEALERRLREEEEARKLAEAATAAEAARAERARREAAAVEERRRAEEEQRRKEERSRQEEARLQAEGKAMERQRADAAARAEREAAAVEERRRAEEEQRSEEEEARLQAEREARERHREGVSSRRRFFDLPVRRAAAAAERGTRLTVRSAGATATRAYARAALAAGRATRLTLRWASKTATRSLARAGPAAKRGAQLTVRLTTAAVARSFALAASAAAASSRRRGEMAWYLAATLLAAGVGLLVTWLNRA